MLGKPSSKPTQNSRSALQRFWAWAYIPIMLAPICLTLGILFVTALATAVLQSFGYAPLYQINEFPTLRHYQSLFTQSGFWYALFLTFYYALVPTILGTGLSIALAVQLRKTFRGKAWFNTLYKLPLMVPYLVGIVIITLLFSNGGFIARVLFLFGLIQAPADFPQILYTQSGWGVMLVYLWKQVPFSTLIILSVMMGISEEYQEAAATLGANRWQTFWYITLPQIMPGIVTASVIVFAFNFGSFEAPYLLGTGFPNTLTVEAWRAFEDPQLDRRLRAMAILVFLGFLSSLLVFGYLYIYRAFERSKGRL